MALDPREKTASLLETSIHRQGDGTWREPLISRHYVSYMVS